MTDKPEALPAVELDYDGLDEPKLWYAYLLCEHRPWGRQPMAKRHLAQLIEALSPQTRAAVLGDFVSEWMATVQAAAESRATRAEARVAELETFVRDHGKTILCARVDASEGPSMPKLFAAAQEAMVPLVEALARIAEMDKR